MKPMVMIMKWSSYFLLSTSALVAQDNIEARNKKLQQVELFYQMAERAYEKGDLTGATEAIRAALQMSPKHGRSIALYRKMQSGGGERASLALRKRIFSKVRVPRIDFDDMNVREALKALSDIVEKESNDKVIPNFVIQDRNKVFDKVSIDLTLKNIPAGDVLTHILSEANATVSFGKYSTVVRPRSSGVRSKTVKKTTEPDTEVEE